jgi:hypothetical protein
MALALPLGSTSVMALVSPLVSPLVSSSVTVCDDGDRVDGDRDDGDACDDGDRVDGDRDDGDRDDGESDDDGVPALGQRLCMVTGRRTSPKISCCNIPTSRKSPLETRMLSGTKTEDGPCIHY